MTKETRAQKIEREYQEMLAKVKARYIAGAAALPHNQKKG
jgi:hypothetical protein